MYFKKKTLFLGFHFSRISYFFSVCIYFKMYVCMYVFILKLSKAPKFNKPCILYKISYLNSLLINWTSRYDL